MRKIRDAYLPTNCFDNKDFPQYFLILWFSIRFLAKQLRTSDDWRVSLQRTRTIHCPADSADIHKVCPYDLYDIFAHTKGPFATVGTYFYVCPKAPLECSRDVHSWRLPHYEEIIKNRSASKKNTHLANIRKSLTLKKKRLKAFTKRQKKPLLIQMHWWLLRKKSTQNRTIKIFQKWLLSTNCFDNKDFPQYFLFFDFPIDLLYLASRTVTVGSCEAITNFGRLKDAPTAGTDHSLPCWLCGHT